MEGKRAVAIVALCMLMLLSEQQQVVAMSKYCACYLHCYNQCWRDVPPFLCMRNCKRYCSPIKEKVAAPMSVADCSKICLVSICGSAAIDTSGAAACVDDCTKNRGQYAKHL